MCTVNQRLRLVSNSHCDWKSPVSRVGTLERRFGKRFAGSSKAASQFTWLALQEVQLRNLLRTALRQQTTHQEKHLVLLSGRSGMQTPLVSRHIGQTSLLQRHQPTRQRPIRPCAELSQTVSLLQASA